MRTGRLLAIVILGMALLSMPTSSAAKKVFRWSSGSDALTMDPHALNAAPTQTGLKQVYETLIRRNAKLQMEPCLATEWRTVDPTHWQFKLRQGVKFHDGGPFTAADVVFSLKRAQSETSGFRAFVKSIKEVNAKDDYTVEIVTDNPNPILPNQLTIIFIMSKAWAEKQGVGQPQDFKKKEETYAVRHANGTGPFKLILREPDVKTVMAKNSNWWGLPDQSFNIDEMVFTPIKNKSTRIAALLSGELDFVLDPPLQDLPRIKENKDLKVAETTEIRTIFFGLDQASPELRSSNVKGKNPFADKRVRQAIYQAIDIEAIRTKVMRGFAVPAGIIGPPGIQGYFPELDKRLPYDPEASKRLLAEAGYPDGFSVTLDTSNDRYINDEAISQACVSMLGKVGIKVSLDSQPKSKHFPKIHNRKTDFYLLGWGNAPLDSWLVFDTQARKFLWNATGYAPDYMEVLIAKIETEMGPEKRDAIMKEAWKIFRDDIVFIPLHHQMIAWAMSKDFNMPIMSNNMPEFRLGSFK